MENGDSLKSIIIKSVSNIDLIEYATASGDYNPIHLIESEANKAGLPGVIAHGMWTMGNLSKLFTSYYNEGFISDYRVKFSKMVFINDKLTLHATLTDKKTDVLDFTVNVTNQNKVNVLEGKIQFTLI